MKLGRSTKSEANQFISLKDDEWLEKQRISGKVVSSALKMLIGEVKNFTNKTMIELDHLAEEFILDNGCQPTFKGYHGFPTCCCMSVNKQLVHTPASENRLNDGDIVTFDLGATYKGVVSDGASTIIYGAPKSNEHTGLVKCTKEALERGVAAIKIGNKLGCIGDAIHRCIKNYGFKTIEKWGGHGIEMSDDGQGIPHAAPFIANKATINDGIRIVPGLVLCIEPMAMIGDSHAWVGSDNWTVYGNHESSHHECTIFVKDSGVEIITEIL